MPILLWATLTDGAQARVRDTRTLTDDSPPRPSDMSSLRTLISRLDRRVFPAFRWTRLRLELERQQTDETGRRHAVYAERAHQRKLWGASAPVPEWAHILLAWPATPESMRPEPKVASTANTTNTTGSSGRRGRQIEDVSALEALVRHLDAHRGAPISILARSWAADQAQLSKRWADPALLRLQTRGVLLKRRGTGRANAPAWHLLPLDEALAKL